MKDVVVIGGGHNGLVAASLLAQGGRNVMLLERRGDLGGICAPIQFAAGYSVPGLVHDTRSFRPEVSRALGLQKDGLAWDGDGRSLLASDGRSSLVLPQGEGAPVSSHPELSAADLSGYSAWRKGLAVVRPVIRRILGAPPPPLLPQHGSDLWQLGKQGLALRRLGKAGMLELLRVLPMSVADWLGEHFQNPLLGEAVALPGVLGGFFGPRAAGTAANLLLHECSCGQAVKGGPAGLVQSLVANCRRRGVALRNDAAVARIVVANGHVTKVRLESGEEISAGTVLATCHPRTTFLKLLQPADLSLKLEDQIRCIRTRGTAAKVHLALKPRLSLGQDAAREVDTVHLGTGSLEGLERVFDAAKYGLVSQPLHLELHLLSRSRGPAQEGEDVVSLWVHTVPFHPDSDWNQQARGQLLDAVLNQLSRFDPEVASKVQAAQVLTPYDLEAGWGLTGGQIFHAERTLDQSLMLRPTAALARYATPIEGLYQGGGASHPGGGISGMPGYLAARTVLDS